MELKKINSTVIKKSLSAFALTGIMASSLMFGASEAHALFSINPTVRTGYEVIVNGNKTSAGYIATYNGTAYIALNRLSNILGMGYELSGDIATFSYQNTKMKVNYNDNSVVVDGKPYELQYGTVEKTINGQKYLFFNIKDIQNIFGIVTSFDADAMEVKLDTGFGILDVFYHTNVSKEIETKAKGHLLEIANKIATKTGSIMVENDQKAYDSLNNFFVSLNAPISQKEYETGITITGVTQDTTTIEDMQHLMNLKMLAGLSQLTIIPEYFGGYELSNGRSTVQVVGVFYSVDGLDVSNADLGVSAVATVEDTFGVSLNDKAAKELQDRITTYATSARSVQHYIIAVLQNGTVKVVDVY